MKTAYIVKAYRTAVGKAPKACSDLKPDELAAETIQYMMNELPDFDKTRIDDDVMVGNAMPEAEQGLMWDV
jgi:acetyl-CoA acyltransferase